MAKYEFFGSGCGSGTSYSVLKDGLDYGTQQPQCTPDENSYFVRNHYGNEVWVNGNQLTTETGQVTDMFVQIIPRTGTWGAYLDTHNITNPTVEDYLAYFDTETGKSLFTAFATAFAIIASAVFIKKRRK